MTEPRYSVVIPVYNSNESLSEIMRQLDQVFEESVRAPYEVIMIDDCSPDPKTWPAIQALTDKYDSLVAIQLMRNFGKTGAVICGFKLARGAFIVTMDDDLQHSPADIPAFIEFEEHDVVMGSYIQRHHRWHKRLTSKLKGWFDQHLLGKPAGLTINPYRMYKAQVAQAMCTIRTPYPFLPALMLYVTRDIVTVPIQHSDRKYGESSYNLFRRLRTFSNLLINNSSFLLRLIAIIGFFIAGVSFVAALYFFIKNLLFDIPVPGWTSLIVTTLVTNGLILFSIGIIGEYLVRIITSIEQRPSYIIRQIIGMHHQSDD